MSEQKIVIGHCLDVLKDMEDECIDVCITSPPYWALRDYGSEPVYYGDWKGQLGLEDNPNDYVKHLMMIFDEIKRVLKPTGACWVNLGDTYATVSGSGLIDPKNCDKVNELISEASKLRLGLKNYGFKEKSLCQIPSRFAISMTDHGWILRNEIIWNKPNAMPMSITDRFTNDFEKVYFFVKNQKYYFNQLKEELRQPDAVTKFPIGKDGNDNPKYSGNRYDASKLEGRNMRTTWSINTVGSSENHCAMYPMELVDRPIRSCCPKGGVVLDPFAGSGTTLRYCFEHDIDCIGIEINPKYKDIIKRKARIGQRKLI